MCHGAFQMQGSYSPVLVLLSLLIAMASSFAVLQVAGRTRGWKGRYLMPWTVAGALVLGTGIWAMHFVGMLAFRLPIAVGYDLATTFLSWLLPVVVSGIALVIAGAPGRHHRRLVAAGLVMGLGICLMHYVGMSAMRLAPGIAYEWPLVLASVAIAVLSSCAALLMFERAGATGGGGMLAQAAAAFMLGLAIAGMHYAGMAAARIAPDAVCLAAQGVDREALAVATAGAVLLVLGLAFGAVLLDAHRERDAARRQAGHERADALAQRELREATARELAMLEVRFHAAQEASVDGFMILSAQRIDERIDDFMIDYANPAARRLLHLGTDSGMPQAFLMRFPTASAFGLFDAYCQVVETGLPFATETEYIGDGILGWFRVAAVRLRDGVAISLADIGERKAADAERSRLLRLEREARIEAERANRLKDEFLAVISHEIRTPLNVITGWAHLLQRSGIDEGALQRGLEIIAQNAHAQGRLLSDLLDMSAIVSGEVQLREDRLDIAALLREAVSAAMPESTRRGIALIDCVQCAGSVVGDATRLAQVFANVLSNALKFTAGNGTVVIEAHNGARNVTVVVRDDGIGIDAAFLPFVFDRFRQADASTSRQHGGLGVGLSIVRNLIMQHRGAVVVESPGVGHGTTVTLTLPLAPSADAALFGAVPAAGPGQLPRLDSVRALVVDADTATLTSLRASLEQAGASVSCAASSGEALMRFDSEPYDVVLCDSSMPVTDALALMRRLRVKAGRRRMLAVAMTAFADRRYADEATRAGFDQVLVKPVTAALLIESVYSGLHCAGATLTRQAHAPV
jgi:signal transduction histidine kinase/NO-binding membrane sensor protein with MHYT domain/ActR/RegA family two-component response regulator